MTHRAATSLQRIVEGLADLSEAIRAADEAETCRQLHDALGPLVEIAMQLQTRTLVRADELSERGCHAENA